MLLNSWPQVRLVMLLGQRSLSMEEWLCILVLLSNLMRIWNTIPIRIHLKRGFKTKRKIMQSTIQALLSEMILEWDYEYNVDVYNSAGSVPASQFLTLLNLKSSNVKKMSCINSQGLGQSIMLCLDSCWDGRQENRIRNGHRFLGLLVYERPQAGW